MSAPMKNRNEGYTLIEQPNRTSQNTFHETFWKTGINLEGFIQVTLVTGFHEDDASFEITKTMQGQKPIDVKKCT